MTILRLVVFRHLSRRVIVMYCFGTADVDQCRIQQILDMGRVELLDHFDAGATIPRNRVNVRAFHQPEANVRVPQAVCGPSIAMAIELQTRSF